MNGTIDIVTWLLEHADSALSLDELTDDPVRRITTLRRRFSPDQARELSRLWDLRRRGRSKYTRADQMFFTSKGLEQGTDEVLSCYKGLRPATQFGRQARLVDLGCGIGGDAIGWSALGGVTLVDRDLAAASFAAHNLRLYGMSDQAIRIRHAEIESIPVEEFDAWHLDPDRRPEGKRRSDPQWCDPPLIPFLTRLPRCRSNVNAGSVKLSPAARVDLLELSAAADCEVELEWIGHRRECQQLVAWFGSLALQPGTTGATWIEADTPFNSPLCSHSVTGDPRLEAEWTTKVANFIHEPQAPVLAAHLTSTLAERYQLKQLGSAEGYLTGPSVVEPLLNSFRVCEVLPYRVCAIAAWLNQVGGYIREIKHRIVSVDVPKVQKEINRSVSPLDSAPYTLFVTSLENKPIAIATQRLSRQRL